MRQKENRPVRPSTRPTAITFERLAHSVIPLLRDCEDRFAEIGTAPRAARRSQPGLSATADRPETGPSPPPGACRNLPELLCLQAGPCPMSARAEIAVIEDGTRPSRRNRPRAPHRRLASETRRILIAHGGPLRAADIVRRLPPELRATVGDASKLPRILRRSQRGGLIETPGGWWVRKPWLRKQETERVPERPRSDLARTRDCA